MQDEMPHPSNCLPQTHNLAAYPSTHLRPQASVQVTPINNTLSAQVLPAPARTHPPACAPRPACRCCQLQPLHIHPPAPPGQRAGAVLNQLRPPVGDGKIFKVDVAHRGPACSIQEQTTMMR